ncbi:MAG TPA: glycosyltransferase [Thermoanaerobaculia bacterium]|nr:glycosyltransferase [Thermoanaerobaculia bacterium]
MAPSPVVSVVMAVYNGRPFVADAVSSILEQRWRDLELLIVNDGSTDGTLDVLRTFRDPRIRVLENPRNLGLTPSLNRAVAEARGELVARIDADDIAERDRLSRQVAFLRAQPRVVLLGTGYREIDPVGTIGATRHLSMDPTTLRWELIFRCPFCHSAAMWRREIVASAVGPYDERFQYAMDWDLWQRIAERFEVANLHAPLVRYRIGEHSMTSTHPAVVRETVALRRRALQRLEWLGTEKSSSFDDRVNRMFDVLFAPRLPADLADVRAGIADVDSLSTLFEDALGLDAHGRRAHRRTWRRQAARRLLREATLRRDRRSDVAAARELFALARQLYAPSLFSVKALRYALACVRHP